MGSEKANENVKKPYSSPKLSTYGDFRKLTLGSNSNKKTDASGRVTKTSVVA
jgi:hypothetical protein